MCIIVVWTRDVDLRSSFIPTTFCCFIVDFSLHVWIRPRVSVFWINHVDPRPSAVDTTRFMFHCEFLLHVWIEALFQCVLDALLGS